ncbi:MAG: zinc-ribbon domain-containing protein [Eubacteriales bacterium]|nr:zinc-ribbon domain-containing protein [Eubacteriales bacterium]
MRKSLYDYCIERDSEALLLQWHPSKNGALTPHEISYGSRKKVWWRCEKGHQWQAAVYTRTSGRGCPYCAGKRTCPGENDLASQRPDIAAQWHPTKNGSVTPVDVLVGSNHRAWWVCEKGHEWQAIVKSRTNGTGCPVCANRKLVVGENDLATTHADLARQWHPTKNGTLTPSDVVGGTWKKVWWRCPKGHEWRTTVVSRTSGGVGCPVCAGKVIISGENDLASCFPVIAAQWDPACNSSLTPESISPFSNRKVWWKCELGHVYTAAVSARTMHNSGCPYCAGRKVLVGFNDLASLQPQIAAQWHPTLNGALTPEMVTVGSHKKVWWECPEGHVWKAVIHSRAGNRKCSCPVCAGKVKAGRVKRYTAAIAAQSEDITVE